jgi:hypothetical protein
MIAPLTEDSNQRERTRIACTYRLAALLPYSLTPLLT